MNGTGIQYAWLKRNAPPVNGGSYNEMEQIASNVPVGSDGLRMYPFGNGAERVLGNIDHGASIKRLQFNRHGQGHLYRAALEGIAFAFAYGFEVMKTLGLDPVSIRVGNDNLFQSQIFSSTVASITGCNIDVVDTTGAVGAALASGYGIGIYSSLEEAVSSKQAEVRIEPVSDNRYLDAFNDWKSGLTDYIP